MGRKGLRAGSRQLAARESSRGFPKLLRSCSLTPKSQGRHLELLALPVEGVDFVGLQGCHALLDTHAELLGAVPVLREVLQ